MTAPALTFANLPSIAEQGRFDATRPPCPPWCAQDCNEAGHFGDAVMHAADLVEVPSTPDEIGATGHVAVMAWRVDSLDEPSTSGVELRIDDAGCLMGDGAQFSAAQARKLAAELLNAADRIDPAPDGESDILATEVRIGDLFQVDGEWLYVYMVSADEASGSADIFVTVDQAMFPETEGDEVPYRFELSESIRVRRHSVPTFQRRDVAA